MLHRAGSIELPASASSGYRARRSSESAAGAAQSGLYASNTCNVEPSPPLACHRTVVSAGVRELAAPMPMSLTTDYQGSSSAAINDLCFKIQYRKTLQAPEIKNFSYVFQLQTNVCNFPRYLRKN